jgi:hypothetical protein
MGLLDGVKRGTERPLPGNEKQQDTMHSIWPTTAMSRTNSLGEGMVLFSSKA